MYFTQFIHFVQAFFDRLWEWWETRALPPHRKPVFQNSSIPQRKFRKSNHLPSSHPTTISEDFPLFQPELRVLLSFLYIFYPFPHPPSRREGSHSKTAGWQCIADRVGDSRTMKPDKVHSIQRCTPVFHARVYVKMNTINVKKR